MNLHVVVCQGAQECRHRRSMLIRQQNFMEKLVNLVKIITRESGNRKKKVINKGDRLQLNLN